MLEVTSPDFERYARVTAEVSDRVLVEHVGDHLDQVAAEIGDLVIAEGSERMPHAGGLSALIRGSGHVEHRSLRGRMEVELNLSAGANLATLDRGDLFHLVYGQLPVVHQAVPEGAFTDALHRHGEKAAEAAQKGVEAALEEIARKV